MDNNVNNTYKQLGNQQNMPRNTQMYYQPNMYLPPKKVYSPLEKKDNAFVLIFLAAMFVFVDFALFNAFSLGFTISYFILFAVSSVYLWNKGEKKDVFSLLCGVISLAGSVTFALYSNYFINTIMFVLIAGLFSLYCLGISGSYSSSRGNFKLLINLFTSTLVKPFENFTDIIGSLRAGAAKSKKQYGALFGFLLAIPVLVVIIPLLVKSDAAFEGLIKAVARNIGKYLLELAIAIVITPVVFSFMYGKRKKINHDNTAKNFNPNRIFPISGSVSFLSVISVTYVVYLMSQLAYFFSAFSGILPKGYTRSASEFARRGFYEMFVICAINVIIISLIGMLTRRNEGRVALSVKLLSLFISAFSVLLIVSAIQKMKLNITTFGFTRNRLLVFTFMLMMLVVIAFFVVHIFAPKVSYMQSIIIICSLMFIALSFADIDSLTYKYNYEAYKSGNIKTMDMYTVSNLCPSEAYYVKLAKSGDAELSHKAVTRLLDEKFESADFEGETPEGYYNLENGEITYKKKDFRAFNLASRNAEKSVVNYYNSLSDSEKEVFSDTAAKVKRYYYDFDKDVFEDYENNCVWGYNSKTGKYDIKKNLE